MLVAYNYSSLCDILGNLINNGICVEKDDVKYNILGNINVFSSSRLNNKDLNYIYNQLNTIVSSTYEYINLYTGNTEEKKILFVYMKILFYLIMIKKLLLIVK